MDINGWSRRRFVQRAAGGLLLLAADGRSSGQVFGDASRTSVASRGWTASSAPDSTLADTDVHLTISPQSVNFSGAARVATVVNGRVPGPLLLWRAGDEVTVRVTNRLTAPTSIHWHGMLVPAAMDGVPGISFPGIAPGATFVYRFRLQQSGTYWYHSHSRFQEQLGLYGPIVIQPRSAEPRRRVDREHVLLLSDWTDLDPEHIYRTLKVHSDYFNYGKRTAGEFLSAAAQRGVHAALEESTMWGAMRMDPTDLLDVSGAAYTYLLNGLAPEANWTALFEPHERVRLRIINGSSMSFFDIRIPGLPLTVVAADGQEVDPVTVDELRLGAAETCDVMVSPQADTAYTIFAQAIDRSGYARGTLAPSTGMSAPIPPLDPRPALTMADMAMDMSAGMSSTQPHHAVTGEHPTSALQGFGPNVDSIAREPASRLDDPGVGLRHNGRRVLTYADLHTVSGPLENRAADRELRLHLTGHMQRYVWSFDGRKFSQSAPLLFDYGERLRITLINDSMMLHPIHLHGMWSEVERPTGEFLVRKHTVTVQPGQELSFAVSVNAPGHWAFHCHLLYHMEAGMFREVAVRGPDAA